MSFSPCFCQCLLLKTSLFVHWCWGFANRHCCTSVLNSRTHGTVDCHPLPFKLSAIYWPHVSLLTATTNPLYTPISPYVTISDIIISIDSGWGLAHNLSWFSNFTMLPNFIMTLCSWEDNLTAQCKTPIISPRSVLFFSLFI